ATFVSNISLKSDPCNPSDNLPEVLKTNNACRVAEAGRESPPMIPVQYLFYVVRVTSDAIWYQLTAPLDPMRRFCQRRPLV
ncbi:MAG: hypothetical protein WCQ21_33705, partial [Verrucomicrobiota bacterium]